MTSKSEYSFLKDKAVVSLFFVLRDRRARGSGFLMCKGDKFSANNKMGSLWGSCVFDTFVHVQYH